MLGATADGPYKVVSPTSKKIFILVNDRVEQISHDRVITAPSLSGTIQGDVLLKEGRSTSNQTNARSPTEAPPLIAQECVVYAIVNIEEAVAGTWFHLRSYG